MSIGAKTPALKMSERVASFGREPGRSFGCRRKREEKSRRPRQRLGAGSLDIVQSHILMSSSRSSSWFRGQSCQILCECDGVPDCDGKRHQHRWEQLQRTCHLITKRHTRTATVKYRTTSTSIALSWNF